MKTGAIWWRVSRDDQKEISPDTQIGEALAMAQAEGFVVPEENILGADWHSLSVWDSPAMEQLKQLIRTQVIQGVFMYEPDRSPSKPVHRLLFRALCQENGVSIRCRHGQIPDGDMGEVMEFLSAWAKEKQVHRAQQGARDGLRDRVKLKGLPAAPKNPYGYAWNAERTRLQTTTEWPNAEFICRSGLEGMPIRRIRRELHRRSVPSPLGREWWTTKTIHGILTGPMYGGRFYALRWEGTLPEHRRTQSYGKSSCRRKPLEEATLLPNIVVESPPLTWNEWLALQDGLKANQLRAQRNAKQDYLGRSIIFCDTHRRRFRVHCYRGRHYYECPLHSDPAVGPCPRHSLSGAQIDERIKAICREVLTNPEIIEGEIRQRAGQVEVTLGSLQKSLAALDKKGVRNRDTESNLLMEKATGKASIEAYERCLALVKAERVWISEERQRLQTQLDTIQQGDATLLGLAKVRETLAAKLDSAASEDWGRIITALALEVHVTEEGEVEVRLAIPVEKPPIVFPIPLRLPRV